jgi:hypothetical protein
MTLNDVLLSLLEPTGAKGGTHLVSWDTVQQWPVDALDKMVESGILTTAAPAQSIECRECDNRCFMEIHRLPGADKRPDRAFIVCDDPEMQGQMGRIQIPLVQLQQWKVTALQLARVTAGLLAIECKAEDRHGQTNIRIGMIRGKKGRRWLSLNKSPLTLEINDHRLPLEEVLFFEDEVLTIDRKRIDQLINKAPSTSGKKYKPSTEKRETGKRETEAMHADWQEEYLKLRRKYPPTTRQPDSWIAKQIAKLDIAQGRDSETIRKNMK